MATQAVDVKCPGCGAPVSTAEKTCKYCRRPIVITSFNSVYEMPVLELNKYSSTYKKMLSENPDNAEVSNSLAMCYLKLKLYDKALIAFDKALEDDFDNAETYFYAAVCLLKGKKAFLASRQDKLRSENRTA